MKDYVKAFFIIIVLSILIGVISLTFTIHGSWELVFAGAAIGLLHGLIGILGYVVLFEVLPAIYHLVRGSK